ncbi:MAG: B12-binding domain-containing radical SAM protein [Deltaproteobacteria bacterium]|nr:B12-binding domain-containing radical SAM protein [Deltaproteobacteria bacterium]
MFQHVLCVYPYQKELNRNGFFPPLGLECIAAVIEPHARSVDIIDLRKEDRCTIDFLNPRTDMVCFSVNWNLETEFVRDEILSVPSNIFTVLGGRHVTEDPERWFSACPNVDVIVRGDGEEIVEDFIRGVSLEEIPGLSFRSQDKIYHNAVRGLQAVSNDRYPNRNRRRYTYEVTVEGIGTGIGIDTLSGSRGCPFNCAFCSFNHNPWGEKRKWSGRSPQSIVEELSCIKAPVVGFTDDLFTYDMDRVEQICDLILARGIRKKFLINTRLEIARHPDVLKKMEQAGFAMLLLGVESAHDKTLRSMGKGFNTAKIRKYFDVLRDRPMILHGYFILGNIGESMEEMEQSVPFAHELGLDTLGLSALRNSPFSGLEELVAKNTQYHIAPNGKIYSDHCSLKELRLLRRRLYREFYTQQQMRRLLNKGLRTGLLSLLPQFLSRIPLIAYSLALRSRRRKVKYKMNHL